MSYYVVENLISLVKLKTMMPISQATFQTPDLLTIMTELMQTDLVSELIKVREDFFLEDKNVPVTANLPNYGIPSRAIGTSIKELFYVDSNANEIPLPRGDENDRTFFATQTGFPQRHYLHGDEIIILPTPSSTSGSLKFVYPCRPNILIATTSCAKITGMATVSGTTTFSVDTDLSTSLTTSSKVDFIPDNPPFKCWSRDIPITAITSTTIAVASTGIQDGSGAIPIAVGDYICPMGYSNIPQLPVEHHSVLAQMAASFIMEALGDQAKLQTAEGKLNKLRDAASVLVKNRVESTPKRVTPRKRFLRYLR